MAHATSATMAACHQLGIWSHHAAALANAISTVAITQGQYVRVVAMSLANPSDSGGRNASNGAADQRPHAQA